MRDELVKIEVRLFVEGALVGARLHVGAHRGEIRIKIVSVVGIVRRVLFQEIGRGTDVVGDRGVVKQVGAHLMDERGGAARVARDVVGGIVKHQIDVVDIDPAFDAGHHNKTLVPFLFVSKYSASEP